MGFWKNEMGSEFEITEVLAPRVKVYYIGAKNINTGETDETLKCKGTKKDVVKDQIKRQNYQDAVFLNKSTYCDFNKIASKNHEINTVRVRKRAMNGFEDKRVMRKITFY